MSTDNSKLAEAIALAHKKAKKKQHDLERQKSLELCIKQGVCPLHAEELSRFKEEHGECGVLYSGVCYHCPPKTIKILGVFKTQVVKTWSYYETYN